MDPTPPEEGVPQKSEVIRLGQDFALFDPKRTAIRDSHAPARLTGGPLKEFLSHVVLNTNGVLPEFEIGASANFSALSIYQKPRIIAPFEPEIGYAIDEADFDTEKRAEKVSQEDWTERSSPTQKLILRLKSYFDSSITEADLMRKIKPQYVPFLQTLRAQLQFPSGITLESKPTFGDFMTESMSFNYFYPLDFRPLASVPKERLDEGLSVLLPSDLDQLSQIMARYVISTR